MQPRKQTTTRCPALVVALTVILTIAHHDAHSATYTVCSSGCNYASINTAVSAQLGAGVTIEVSGGPYLERVVVNNKNGTASSRAVIKAVGIVIVDGSDPYNNSNLWTQYNSGPVYYASTATMTPPNSQVFVDDVRYKYVAGTSYSSLQTGEYGYDAAADLVYVNVGGGNPGTKATFVGNNTRVRGFDVDNSDYVTIDGFTVLRFDQQGIDIRGTSTSDLVESAIVTGCTSSRNWNQGVYLRFTSNSLVLDNITSDNANHGIYLISSNATKITSNHSYRNDDPELPRGGVAGIKLDGADSTEISDVTIDYNLTHDNEDTGIDLKGARRVLVRRNASYRNQDHGYDNKKTNHTVFLNNVAVRNDHDGLSVENDSKNVEIYNCIFAHNAVNAQTLASPGNVRELFVDNTSGFKSDYNILVGLTPGSIDGGVRHLVEFPSADYDNLSGYVSGTTDLDEHSHSSDPMFADSANGDFKVTSMSSDAIDKGRSDLSGWTSPWWLAADARGFVAHDVANVSGGAGSPAYSDRGAFEFDSPPGAPTATVEWGSDHISVSWTARGDDVDTGTAGTYEVVVNGGVAVSGNPGAPSTLQCEFVSGLVACTQGINVKVRIRDVDNGQSAESNVVTGSTSCTGHVASCGTQLWGGGGGDEMRAARTRGEQDDLPLTLTGPQPNPSLGDGLITWSIPRGLAGEVYELSVFDLAGRRISTLASGAAEAGRFSREMSLWPRSGSGVGTGVYFVRLRIGRQSVTRPVILSR